MHNNDINNIIQQKISLIPPHPQHLSEVTCTSYNLVIATQHLNCDQKFISLFLSHGTLADVIK